VEFTYDALGRRLSKSFGTTVTRWIWNGNVPLHQWKRCREYSVMGNRWNTDTERRDMTVWLFDEESFVPVAMIKEGRSYSILTDQLGTPTEAYDAEGNEVWSRVLDMDGNVIGETGNKGMVPFLFQGQYYDRETGLAYNRFRYYSPKMGMYVSQDPIGLAGGICLYNYVTDTNILIDWLGWHEVIAILDGQPVLTDKGKYSWYSNPGSSDAQYNGYGAAGHSEAKLLEALDKRNKVGDLSGKVLDIHSMGQMTKGGVSQLSPLAPCNRCEKGLQNFAIKHNMTIRYHYVDDEGHKKTSTYNPK
ncbi:RHS repeat domain-containing protein, partial [Bacteroides stercoris]|uniref:RHS repeat domain-containing protein n=1 Tax=Bacteroides stercoris TaxID=46506 RepID=UPI00293D6DCA